MIRWLAFDIGCIECGESSDVIGVFFLTVKEAEEAAANARKIQMEDWHGQHSMEVFKIDIPEEKLNG